MKKILLLGAIGALLICCFSSSANANGKQVASTTQISLNPTTENWDAVIDKYEKCIDKYLAAYKKLQAGDVSQGKVIEKISMGVQTIQNVTISLKKKKKLSIQVSLAHYVENH